MTQQLDKEVKGTEKLRADVSLASRQDDRGESVPFWARSEDRGESREASKPRVRRELVPIPPLTILF